MVVLYVGFDFGFFLDLTKLRLFHGFGEHLLFNFAPSTYCAFDPHKCQIHFNYYISRASERVNSFLVQYRSMNYRRISSKNHRCFHCLTENNFSVFFQFCVKKLLDHT